MSKKIRVKIKFIKDSPYYENGEKERIVKNITEVHYNYESAYESTALESDIDGTGFTVFNKNIKEFEVRLVDESEDKCSVCEAVKDYDKGEVFCEKHCKPDESECDCCGWDDDGYQCEPQCSSRKIVED